MNPYQARMDYDLAVVNVGLTLLDAGVAVNSVRKVVAARGAVQALGTLEPAQVKQFSEATQLEQAGKTAEAEGAFQTLQKQVGEKKYQDIRKARRILLGLSDPEAGGIRLSGKSKPAPQRIAAMTEERALEVGQRLERIDGGHSLDRHGANVMLEQLDKRLKTGVAPDGVVSFAPASTRFNSNKNWLQTRQQAVETFREKYKSIVGDDLRKPPQTGDPQNIEVKVRYGKPIDDGFVRDPTTKKRVTIPVDPITGKPTIATPGGKTKTGNVYTRTEPVEGVTGVYTNFVWNAAEGRWKIVQHYPLVEEWNNAAKVYNSPQRFDAEVELP
jgi:hypothetical protein